MKRMFFLILLVFVGVAAWRISERLSADALGMALGVFFGVLAGIPVALLVIAASRRREDHAEENTAAGRRGHELPHQAYPAALQQPPVIVLAGPGFQQMQQNGYPQANQMLLDATYAPNQGNGNGRGRQFRVVGESDESIEE